MSAERSAASNDGQLSIFPDDEAPQDHIFVCNPDESGGVREDRRTQITELRGESWEDAFGGAAHARTSDPSTSHDAAASLSSERLRATQLAVLACFRANGPMHHELLVTMYGSAVGPGCEWPLQSVSGLRTRTKELVDRGLIEDSGDRVVLVSGRQSIVWRVA